MPERAYLLEVPVGEGNPVLVEVTDVDGGDTDLVPASRAGAVIGRARTTLEAALAELQPTIRALADWARASAPDEVGVEFGLKLGSQANLVIASGKAEVNFVVKLTWRT